jgi:cobalt-zinc-cadmium efflux system membrane fusion protein
MVFVKRGEELEATPVVVGIKDAQWVEVLSGLTAGQCYVSSNSFFIKAEIGKAGASDED